MSQPDTIVPDPLDPQAWDRYAYVNNSPVNSVDPTGHYGITVHFWLTWHLVYREAYNYGLNQMGMSRSEAREFGEQLATDVAQADVDVDNVWKHPEENPTIPPSESCDDISGACTTSKTHHWYTTEEAEDELGAATDSEEFGTAMHAYQDSYSHWQRLGKPNSANGIQNGHAANQTERLDCWLQNARSSCDYDTERSIDNYDPENNQIDRDMRDGTRMQIRDFLSRQFQP